MSSYLWFTETSTMAPPPYLLAFLFISVYVGGKCSPIHARVVDMGGPTVCHKNKNNNNRWYKKTQNFMLILNLLKWAYNNVPEKSYRQRPCTVKRPKFGNGT
jgi:hypothetical protein